MIKNISYIYLQYILNYPKYAIILMLIILAGMMSNISNFRLDASTDSLILENDKDLIKYRNIVKDYGAKDFIVMTLTPNNGDISSKLDKIFLEGKSPLHQRKVLIRINSFEQLFSHLLLNQYLSIQ